MDKRILTPKEIALAICETGIAKAQLRFSQVIVLGIFAGAFIALGAQGALTIAQTLGQVDAGLQKFAMASIFPIGLMLVVVCGGELFTGNNLMTLGCMNLKYSWQRIARNWTLVYFSNMIGALLIVLLVVGSGVVAKDTPFAELAIKIATKKVHLSFMQALYSGILCNLLVSLAVWMAAGARDVISKLFACWFPVMLFVLSGYEHSIANMFYLPIGLFLGAPITWAQIALNNLLPVTIGNIIGGAVIVPWFYHVAYMREPKKQK